MNENVRKELKIQSLQNKIKWQTKVEKPFL